MKLEENFTESIDFSLKLLKDAGRFIILIILCIIPIVNFIVLGYVSRVVKETPRSDSPPALEKYDELWVEGAKVFVAALIYFIVPGLLLGLGAAFFAPFPFPPFLLGLRVIIISLALILLFLALIFAVIGLVHMIKTEDFGNAFNFERIISIIKSYGWGRYLLWLLIVYAIVLVISAIGTIPYIGWIITAVISPLLAVFLGRSAALVYEEGAVPPPPPNESIP